VFFDAIVYYHSDISNQTTKMAEQGGVEASVNSNRRGMTHLLFI